MCNNSDLLSQCRTLISITVHSLVAFDRDPKGQLHRHSIAVLTDDTAQDTAHDHHALEPSSPCKVYHCGQLQMDVQAVGSQWQHSVPRALRTETNLQTNGELFNSNHTS
ncbi:hypothetical protein PoB_001808900 [Plakobranchus ocellatus]|uniref:Uncharacterized protein n=1 Tax=Plakobranchus ocellatus TaxID=259542 RepID=A0AAV3ZCD5_9GAST|nr:hypothetical protein PoB_001808900 [Plakobranchus ocellatus]